MFDVDDDMRTQVTIRQIQQRRDNVCQKVSVIVTPYYKVGSSSNHCRIKHKWAQGVARGYAPLKKIHGSPPLPRGPSHSTQRKSSLLSFAP